MYTGVNTYERGTIMQREQGPSVAHVNHLENRLAYAQRIIRWLDKHVENHTAASLALFNRATWDRIATLAGEERKPSEATISTIVGMVRGKELMAKALGKALHDADDRLMSNVEVMPTVAAMAEAERL